MLYEFDHEKSEENFAKHKVAMADALDFEWGNSQSSPRQPQALC
jgi:uncharacterized DUF497 family protein